MQLWAINLLQNAISYFKLRGWQSIKPREIDTPITGTLVCPNPDPTTADPSWQRTPPCSDPRTRHQWQALGCTSHRGGEVGIGEVLYMAEMYQVCGPGLKTRMDSFFGQGWIFISRREIPILVDGNLADPRKRSIIVSSWPTAP